MDRIRRRPSPATKARFVSFVVRVLTDCGHVRAESETGCKAAALHVVRTLRRDGLRAVLLAYDDRGHEYRCTG